jgi:hypothetical protein
MKCSMREDLTNMARLGEKLYIVTIASKLPDGAYTVGEHTFARESKIKKLFKGYSRMAGLNCTDGTSKVDCEEVTTTTTDALRNIYSRYGLAIDDAYPTREEWAEVLDRLASVAKNSGHVVSLEQVGSLANGAKKGKDADVVMTVTRCPGHRKCEIYKNLLSSDPRHIDERVCIPAPGFSIKKEDKSFDVDLFCVTRGVSKNLNGYRIGKVRKRLL